MKRSKRSAQDPLAIDRMFDAAVHHSVVAIDPPPILYHYTTWSGTEGILRTNTFWATAHDCTNDDAELQSANEIIIEVARHIRNNILRRGIVREVLDGFLDGYSTLAIAKVMTIYLVCFSAARDDEAQWQKYADGGGGVCLGIRVLNEPEPNLADRGTKLVKVDYSEASWRATIDTHFRKVCILLQRARYTRNNILLGLSALNRMAAFLSITAKRDKWAVEREYRLATIVHTNTDIRPHERNSDGKRIRYLPITVRADGKRIALAEILLGPNQNAPNANERLTQILNDAGYSVGDAEYPEIVRCFSKT